MNNPTIAHPPFPDNSDHALLAETERLLALIAPLQRLQRAIAAAEAVGDELRAEALTMIFYHAQLKHPLFRRAA